MPQLLSPSKPRRVRPAELDAIEAALLSAYQTHDWTRSSRSAIDYEFFENKPKRRAHFTRRARKAQ